jgi:hypothetical protein
LRGLRVFGAGEFDGPLNKRSGDGFVVEPLVIPFSVVVLDVLRDRPAEMPLAERDHSAGTLFLDRAHETLRVCMNGVSALTLLAIRSLVS